MENIEGRKLISGERYSMLMIEPGQMQRCAARKIETNCFSRNLTIFTIQKLGKKKAQFRNHMNDLSSHTKDYKRIQENTSVSKR